MHPKRTNLTWRDKNNKLVRDRRVWSLVSAIAQCVAQTKLWTQRFLKPKLIKV